MFLASVLYDIYSRVMSCVDLKMARTTSKPCCDCEQREWSEK